MMYRKLLVVLVLVLAAAGLQACGDAFDRPDLKSPCVGAEDSPCGPRRPVNDWWLS